jgi:hypothetical protein
MNSLPPSPVTRRRFLGAGSALALGALAGSAVFTRPAVAAEASRASDLASKVSAILNRPISYLRLSTHYEWCACADCEAMRARPYTCASCGFSGVPTVFPCECAAKWDEWTSANAEMLRSLDVRGEQWTQIAEFQRRLKRNGRPELCTPPKIQCAHTYTICPVCGDTGGGEDPFNGDEQAVAAMIRDLRALLREER